jgi:hypothetical protein
MTEVEAIRRVRRGAELLDRVHPGWADRVPADERLRMSACNHCVIGHLHGSYAKGINILFHGGYVDFPLFQFGFNIGAESHADQPHAYHLLADAWRAAIRARGGGLPRSPEAAG